MSEKERSLEEWIEIYNKKVFDPFKRDEKYLLLYRPDKGFIEILATSEMVLINQLCGDAAFWKLTAEKIAKISGSPVVGFVFYRNVKAFIRLNNYKICRTEETPDGLRYFCIDQKTGKKAEASPAFTENGQKVYRVFFEV